MYYCMLDCEPGISVYYPLNWIFNLKLVLKKHQLYLRHGSHTIYEQLL